MTDWPQHGGFLLAAMLITATPGPDNLMVLGMGMSRGWRQGLAFGLGCATGCLSHTALAVLGVSALLAASPPAYTALRWLGGGYLVWLGFQALRHAGQSTANAQEDAPPAPLRSVFLQGMVANAINPKVVLFFLSFLPQFVVADGGNVAWQLGMLGVVFTLQAGLLFGGLACFAGTIGGWLARTPRAAAWLDRVAGTVFIALGLRMVASR